MISNTGRIDALKASVEKVEKMPLLMRAGHIMPLVHELIGVLEYQQLQIDRLRMQGDY